MTQHFLLSPATKTVFGLLIASFGDPATLILIAWYAFRFVREEMTLSKLKRICVIVAAGGLTVVLTGDWIAVAMVMIVVEGIVFGYFRAGAAVRGGSNG